MPRGSVCVAALVLAVACASSEEEGLFEEDAKAADPPDASSGTGGSGGSGFDASSGGSAAGPLDSGSASDGAGGTGALGGSGGSGGSGGAGTCNASFCPNTGSGAPCCVTPSGPCGSDMGLGCQANPGPDV